VLFSRKRKPRERFYLLPGQGGRNYYQKQRRLIGWAIAVAVLFGAGIGAIMWWFSRQPLR
jgi:Na+-driven multidrug efflux pump